MDISERDLVPQDDDLEVRVAGGHILEVDLEAVTTIEEAIVDQDLP